MKIKLVPFVTLLSVSGVLAASTTIASAAETDTATTKGTVNFQQDTSAVLPVDPTDPTVPVDPKDPGTGNGLHGQASNSTGLSIDYVSNFEFGKVKYAGKHIEVYAQADKLTYTTKGTPDKEVANRIQVTDKRSTSSGWKITVKQAAAFTAADNTELKGAALSLEGLTVIDASTNKENSEVKGAGSSIQINDQAQAVMGSVSGAANQGRGTFLGMFNPSQLNEGVKLSLPEGLQIKDGDNFSTTLTWSLEDTPL